MQYQAEKKKNGLARVKVPSQVSFGEDFILGNISMSNKSSLLKKFWTTNI